ncbi:MAG: nucleotide-binding protein [Ignisphaera sp.]|uniref:Nucleotide-binding protein n=1 Tax=Ignisphaera aggregans TaxID=334771 RepID=A0A7C4JJX7_9CREN
MSDSRDLQRLNVFRYANSKHIICIFDTAAFLSSLQLHVYVGDIVTTPSVVQEVKDSESASRLEIALSIGRFKVEAPLPEYVEKARDIARNMKLLDKLSQTDIDVLALTLKYRNEGFKPMVFTDDYDIQRILKSLGIDFKPVKNLGIERRFNTSSPTSL